MASLGQGEAPLAEFRRTLSTLYAADEILLLCSGTQALQLGMGTAVRTLGSAAVALSCFGCYDIAAAAVGAGRPVRFYDLDPHTLSPDLESVSRAVQEGAQVVVAAPLYGLPVDVDGLREVLGPAGGLLLEDAAQGHGGRWGASPLGGLGDLSVLSFGRGKGWTGGGGGALLFRSGMAGAEAAPGALAPSEGAGRQLLSAARSLAQWALGRPSLYGIPMRIPGLHLGETLYHPPVPPRALAPFSAALALATRVPSDREAETRRTQALWLRERIREGRAPALRLVDPVGGEAGYLRLPVLVRGARALEASRSVRRTGVQAAYPRLLPALEPLRPLIRGEAGRFPGGEELRERLMTAPTHSGLSRDDLEGVARALERWHP